MELITTLECALRKIEDLEKENLKEYIKKNIGNIIDIIVNGIKQNTLDKVFIIQKFVEE